MDLAELTSRLLAAIFWTFVMGYAANWIMGQFDITREQSLWIIVAAFQFSPIVADLLKGK